MLPYRNVGLLLAGLAALASTYLPVDAPLELCRCDMPVAAVPYRLVDHGGHHAALVIVVIAALRFAFAVVGPTPPVPIAHVGSRRPLRLGAAAFLRPLHGRPSVRFLLAACNVVAGVGCARIAFIMLGVPDAGALIVGLHVAVCGVLLFVGRQR